MGIVSFPSRAVNVFVVDEVENLDGEFIYNFYTTDQSTNETVYEDPTSLASVETIGKSLPSSEVPIWKEYVKGVLAIEGELVDPAHYYPRYNVLSWAPSTVGSTTASSFLSETYTYGERAEDPAIATFIDIAETENWSELPDIQSKIAYEESINNTIFCGLNMQPTGFDKDLYNRLSGYAIIQALIDERNETSTLTGFTDSEGDLFDAASEFITSLDEGMSPEIKRLLVRALTDYQSVGFYEMVGSIAPFSNIAHLLDINASVNQKVILNTVKRSYESFEGCFSPQAGKKINDSASLQDTAAATIPAGIVTTDDVTLVTSDDLDTPWEPFQIFEFDYPFYLESFADSLISIGYIIDKFREEEDGQLTSYDPIFIDGTANTAYLDPHVAFGKRYIYKVRTVFLVHFTALNITEDDGSRGGELAVARVLIASRGSHSIIIDTFDNEAPDPPEFLSFSFNPDRGGMVIFWEHPLDLQGDICAYQIYSRDNIEDPYTLIGEIRWGSSTVSEGVRAIPENMIERTSITKTYFVDTEFDEAVDKKYYAVTAGDRLGFISGYSAQYYVSYDILRQRTKSVYVSRPGAPRPYPNIYVREEVITDTVTAQKSDTTKFDFFIDTMKDSHHSRLKIYFNPDAYTINGRTLRSLPGTIEELSDTLETYDAPTVISPIVNTKSGIPAYKLLILNTDLQKSEIVNIFVQRDI